MYSFMFIPLDCVPIQKYVLVVPKSSQMASTVEVGDEAYFPTPMKESFFEDGALCIPRLVPESF